MSYKGKEYAIFTEVLFSIDNKDQYNALTIYMACHYKKIMEDVKEKQLESLL